MVEAETGWAESCWASVSAGSAALSLKNSKVNHKGLVLPTSVVNDCHVKLILHKLEYVYTHTHAKFRFLIA